MSDALISRGGLLTFAHDFLSAAARDAYLPTVSHQQQAHARVADHFERLIFQGVRHTNEIAWQLTQAEQWGRLYSKLADLGFLYVLYVTGPTDVMRFWAQLEAHSNHKAATAYQTLLASPDQYEPRVVQLVASLLVPNQPAESLRLFEHLEAHFRAAEGFWKAYPPFRRLGLDFAGLADPQWFERDPRLAWEFYGHLLNLYRHTHPHVGFALLQSWMERCPLGGFVFTSNVDGIRNCSAPAIGRRSSR